MFLAADNTDHTHRYDWKDVIDNAHHIGSMFQFFC